MVLKILKVWNYLKQIYSNPEKRNKTNINNDNNNNKNNLVRERTVPNGRPPLVDEVSANF
jgi:hypothetical protein